MADINLEFLARQNERILTEMARLRDAIDVLTAMAIRSETSLQTMQQELHVGFRSEGRLHARVSKLEDEDAVPPS